ncbi:hypothetical protein GCM10027569_09250 [Flindersiella endophytica]
MFGLVNRLAEAIAMVGSTPYEKTPKDHQQRRIVLDEYSADLLRAFKRRSRTTAETLGLPFNDEAFVFSLEPDRSKPWKPSSVTWRYGRMARKLGIKTTIHKLRHYSATELIAGGVDVRTVAGRLGHGGGGTTTLKVYAAFVSEADQRAAKCLLDRIPRPPVTITESGAANIVTAEPAPRGPYEVIAADLRGAIRCGALRAGRSPASDEGACPPVQGGRWHRTPCGSAPQRGGPGRSLPRSACCRGH